MVRIRMRPGVSRIACATLMVLGGHVSIQASERYRVEKANLVVTCPLTVGGSFEAKTAALSGEVSPPSESSDVVDGALVIELKTLETGIRLRDKHLRQNYLEVDKGPGFATATLEQITIADGNGTRTFRGLLTIHGQQREIAGKASVRREGRGLYVEASFPLRISDFEIPQPSYLGVGVANDIRVHVTFHAVAAN